MNKIYVVSHIHLLSKEKGECLEGHVDEKHIGIFFSRDKANEIIEKYKLLEGFRDFTDGFHIDEYLINSIYNKSINELLIKKVPSFNELDFVFLLYYVNEFEDGHEETKILGVFSSKEKAASALNELLKIKDLKFLKNKLIIDKNDTRLLGWQEGFTTIIY